MLCEMLTGNLNVHREGQILSFVLASFQFLGFNAAVGMPDKKTDLCVENK
jgi:hypothetical protein